MSDLSETVKSLKKDYFADLMKMTISHNFKPVTEYALELFGFPMSGYPNNRGTCMKKMLSDIDGVLNTTSLFGEYMKSLYSRNPMIKLNRSRLEGALKGLGPENVDGPVEEFSRILSDSRLSLIDHLMSCKYAAENVEITRNAIPYLRGLKRMCYDVEFFSGSPDTAVKMFVAGRLGIDWLNQSSVFDCARGSDYVFDEYGNFLRIMPMLYEYKKVAAEKVLEESVGTKNGINMVISDDPGDFKMVQSFINPFILAGESCDIPDSVSVAVPEARNDMLELLPVIRKAEMALCFSLGHTLEHQRLMLSEALSMKSACEKMTSQKEDIEDARDSALSHMKKYKELSRKIFSTSDGFTGIDKIARKLETSKEKDSISALSYMLLETFNNYSPHAEIAEHLMKYFR